MSLHARWVVWSAQHVAQRAERERRQALERELAAYRTPSEVADLTALLDCYPDGQTDELRSILWAEQWGPKRIQDRSHLFSGPAPA